MSRFHKLVLWAVRAALFALALQVGGVVHASADVLAAAGILEEEHEQCPPDGACDDCLLGCPNCHCGAGLRTVLPQGAVTLEPAHAAPYLAPGAAEGSNAPLGPTLDSVYRPPRTPVLHHTLS